MTDDAPSAVAPISPSKPPGLLNPCELEIDLFCQGMRIDPSCTLECDARFISRTRAGLGSGLELVIPGPIKDVWVNVPVEEDFAQQSCYELVRDQGEYWVNDTRLGHRYAVRIPPEPAWYTRETRRGTPMHKVGVLQGTYLGIYISNSCGFWYHSPAVNCKFCATGLNVGVNEVARKDIDDVVEVARAAKAGVRRHVRAFQFRLSDRDRDLDEAAPYVKAVKSRVGTLVGLQLIPTLDFWKYDRLIDLGRGPLQLLLRVSQPGVFRALPAGQAGTGGTENLFPRPRIHREKAGQRIVLGRDHCRRRASRRHAARHRLHHRHRRLPHGLHFPPHHRLRHGTVAIAALRRHAEWSFATCTKLAAATIFPSM